MEEGKGSLRPHPGDFPEVPHNPSAFTSLARTWPELEFAKCRLHVTNGMSG